MVEILTSGKMEDKKRSTSEMYVLLLEEESTKGE